MFAPAGSRPLPTLLTRALVALGLALAVVLGSTTLTGGAAVAAATSSSTTTTATGLNDLWHGWPWANVYFSGSSGTLNVGQCGYLVVYRNVKQTSATTWSAEEASSVEGGCPGKVVTWIPVTLTLRSPNELIARDNASGATFGYTRASRDAGNGAFWYPAERMNLYYAWLGLAAKQIGWFDYRLSMNFVNGKPVVYGSILAIGQAEGWNAVGYGTQTLVQCTNNNWNDVGKYHYSLCYLKIKMQKPGNVSGTIEGTFKGLTAKGGYDANSGYSFVNLTGKVEIRKTHADAPYILCYNYPVAHCTSVTGP
ncbi:hypothetical protein ACTMSW_09385 [Micromonospora sp. BQ11]|uniref:hypothetical protein n=1 Tax=Micromonospora sp. BQ11 TaxID=3452212 RepID=UPI003F8B59D4